MARDIIRDGTLVGGAVVRGDAFSIEREVDIDNEAVLTQAELLVALTRGGSPVLSKTVTAVPGPDGAILEDGSVYRGKAVVGFSITAANTLALTAGTRYEYDMRYTTADGSVFTWETGSFVVIDRIA